MTSVFNVTTWVARHLNNLIQPGAGLHRSNGNQSGASLEEPRAATQASAPPLPSDPRQAASVFGGLLDEPLLRDVLDREHWDEGYRAGLRAPSATALAGHQATRCAEWVAVLERLVERKKHQLSRRRQAQAELRDLGPESSSIEEAIKTTESEIERLEGQVAKASGGAGWASGAASKFRDGYLAGITDALVAKGIVE